MYRIRTEGEWAARTEELRKQLGCRIAAERAAQDITQEEMAEMTNRDVKTIREAEKRGEGGLDTFLRMVDILDATGGWTTERSIHNISADIIHIKTKLSKIEEELNAKR